MLVEKKLEKVVDPRGKEKFDKKIIIPGKSEYGENNNLFYYTSPEGLFSQHDSKYGIFEAAEIHFAPKDLDSGERKTSLNYIPEDKRDAFRRKSVIELIVSLSNFIEFIETHPETRIGKVRFFDGHTNKEMANFINTRLNINCEPSIDPVTKKLVYYFYCSIDEIKNGIENIKASSPSISKLLESR